MKSIILIIAGILTMSTTKTYSQSWSRMQLSTPIYKSTWNTSVVNVGNISCQHEWVEKGNGDDESFYGVRISCAVLHDELGCPDGWGHREQICRKCLRKEILRESRSFTDEYLKSKQEKAERKSEYRTLEEELKKRDEKE